MKHYRLSPCNCGESNYRLLPRHWWMRALAGRRRYNCRSCGATMFLYPASRRRLRKRAIVLVAAALVAVAYASFYLVGYREDWSYASEKRAAEAP